jgi:hypothetical protein
MRGAMLKVREGNIGLRSLPRLDYDAAIALLRSKYKANTIMPATRAQVYYCY